jgi:hypothetical protein
MLVAGTGLVDVPDGTAYIVKFKSVTPVLQTIMVVIARIPEPDASVFVALLVDPVIAVL